MSSPSRASHVDSSSSRKGETEESRETERGQDYRSMGLLALKRELKRNHGRGQSDNGSAASSLAKRNRSPCQQNDNSRPQKEKDDDSHGGKKARYIMAPDLPEEIWHHIHSLVPMRDAARAACVSRSFLNSWRCHPNLTFTDETMCSKETLLKGTTDPNYRRNIREYNNNIDCILEKHRDVGVKTFELEFYDPYNTKYYNRLNNWLQIAITPVMEKLTLTLSSGKAKYEFPCSLLSDRSGNMIRHLDLANCILHPTVNLNLRCLTVLVLYEVRITGGELGCLLSNSFGLEKLTLLHCHDMIRLEVPCLLQRLCHFEVFECPGLQVIENKAPNISFFEYTGDEVVQLSLGESLQVKCLKLGYRSAIGHAIDKLHSSVPNLETLIVISPTEIVNAPNFSTSRP